MVERRTPNPWVVGSSPTRPAYWQLGLLRLGIIKMFGKIQKFISEVMVELKKVSWATRQELIDATWIVIISSAFLGVFICATDLIVSHALTLIVR